MAATSKLMGMMALPVSDKKGFKVEYQVCGPASTFPQHEDENLPRDSFLRTKLLSALKQQQRNKQKSEENVDLTTSQSAFPDAYYLLTSYLWNRDPPFQLKDPENIRIVKRKARGTEEDLIVIRETLKLGECSLDLWCLVFLLKTITETEVWSGSCAQILEVNSAPLAPSSPQPTGYTDPIAIDLSEALPKWPNASGNHHLTVGDSEDLVVGGKLGLSHGEVFILQPNRGDGEQCDQFLSDEKEGDVTGTSVLVNSSPFDLSIEYAACSASAHRLAASRKNDLAVIIQNNKVMSSGSKLVLTEGIGEAFSARMKSTIHEAKRAVTLAAVVVPCPVAYALTTRPDIAALAVRSFRDGATETMNNLKIVSSKDKQGSSSSTSASHFRKKRANVSLPFEKLGLLNPGTDPIRIFVPMSWFSYAMALHTPLPPGVSLGKSTTTTTGGVPSKKGKHDRGSEKEKELGLKLLLGLDLAWQRPSEGATQFLFSCKAFYASSSSGGFEERRRSPFHQHLTSSLVPSTLSSEETNRDKWLDELRRQGEKDAEMEANQLPGWVKSFVSPHFEADQSPRLPDLVEDPRSLDDLGLKEEGALFGGGVEDYRGNGGDWQDDECEEEQEEEEDDDDDDDDGTGSSEETSRDLDDGYQKEEDEEYPSSSPLGGIGEKLQHLNLIDALNSDSCVSTDPAMDKQLRELILAAESGAGEGSRISE